MIEQGFSACPKGEPEIKLEMKGGGNNGNDKLDCPNSITRKRKLRYYKNVATN
jgi:hypothetical protein